ncbi:MAG TPA: hypothetical protein VJH91_01615 [Candidatus Paceibacterota bacterium]
MKNKKGISLRGMEKAYFNKNRQQTPPRVAARMEGKAKNTGSRPARKQPRGKH